MKTYIPIFLILLFSACEMAEQGAINAIDKAFQDADGGGGIKEAMAEIEKISTEANDGKKVEIVGHRELKALLPDRLAGYSLDKSEGETTGFGSMKISLVSAQYGNRREGIDAQVTDGGSLGLMAFASAGWMHMDMDQSESDGSFERTIDFEGHRGYESYDAGNAETQLTLVVGKRFLVDLSGKGVDMTTLKKAMRGIDTAALAKMAG